MTNSPFAVIAGIYPILDAGHLAMVAIEPIEIARLMDRLAIGCVQLRCKGSSANFARFARPWVSVLRRFAPRVKIIINDNLELAMALDAHGVHVGQEDCNAALCRATLGKNKLLGVSTHSVAEIQRAVAEGADYVGFGPIFPTISKPDAHGVQGIPMLRTACAGSPIPVVAIGGMEQRLLAEVADSGAAAAAMISGILNDTWHSSLTECCRTWQDARR